MRYSMNMVYTKNLNKDLNVYNLILKPYWEITSDMAFVRHILEGKNDT